jgi:acyl-CoA reductase-like NAD-dependent aldehyde dehydrogenase
MTSKKLAPILQSHVKKSKQCITPAPPADRPRPPHESSSSPLLELHYATNTGQIRDTIQFASPLEIQNAIDDARIAQAKWHRDYTPSQRAEILLKASTLISSQQCYADDLKYYEVKDTARTISEISSYDIPTASRFLSYYAHLPCILSQGTYHDNVDSTTSFAIVKREPIGITVGIGAWNYPLMNAVAKSAPALSFGNAMLFKPSELTPNSALLLADIYEKSGLPPGVFQVLLGDGSVGEQLVKSRQVGKISFTGSVETGKVLNRTVALASAAATAADGGGYFPKITLELGGKSPLIVMEDADLDQAVQGAMMGNWYSNGQVCSNGTRVFVHDSLVDEFVERIVERTMKLKIGDPMNMDTDLGPMISEQQMKRVLEYVAIGRDQDGAQLVFGGERYCSEGHADPTTTTTTMKHGNYVTPAIFTKCTDDMRIVREEVFGMLMCILTFQDEEEVIVRANATEYGLAAGIFTKDISRAYRMASRLEAGNIWVNTYNVGPVELPWGGRKQSGIGRENGSLDAMFEWTQSKSVYVETEKI